MTTPVLQVDGLAKAFGGIAAVAGVSLAVAAGEVVALIGPNGAGKTTCFNLINGQLKPDAGQVRLDGERIDGLSPRDVARRGVGRTFQVSATFASMTARENVQLALIAGTDSARDVSHAAASRHAGRADDMLARAGIAEFADAGCATLAYGDAKRVELAVALATEPKLLLMDEPTAGMPARHRAALMRLAVDMARSKRIAVLFTEHDMDVVFDHADRIIVLDRGRIIAQGTPAEIRADPRAQEAYLGAG